MRPTSLSATALQVANLCLARYNAEHILRARTPGKSAANLGSTVHQTLEWYVKACYLEKKQEPSPTLLANLYAMAYTAEYGSYDMEDENFVDGMDMLTKWYNRTDFSDREVLSCEVKETFPIPTSIGEIPYNYIWDRFDKTGPDEYTVVDYKSNRWAISADELERKVQARCYALAAAIKLRAQGIRADRIWVVFDLLRHEPVGRVFTREQNAATWKFIKDEAERIIAAPDEDLPETLNSECVFCVRMQTCNALRSNVLAGGIMGLDFDAAIDRRQALANQVKALGKALEQLDDFIMTEAKQKDIIEYETDMTELGFSVSSRRAVDGERVEHIVGSDLFNKYGGLQITMGQFDKLMKDKSITEAQRGDLKRLVYKNLGEPRVSTKPKNPIDEE